MEKLVLLILIFFFIKPTYAEINADEYLSPLKLEVIEYSEFEKIQVPTAELKIKVTGDESLIYEADRKPWPSWWYPSSEQELFYTFTIFNEKDETDVEFKASTYLYDFIYAGNKNNSSKDLLQNLFEPNASWSGACTLWALASIYTQQPEKTYCYYQKEDQRYGRYQIEDNSLTSEREDCENVDGEVLYPGHMKSLLALSFRPLSEWVYFFDDYIFGQINKGTGSTDIKDIYPHEFLQLLIYQLGEKKFPAIMDLDLSEAVWNHPIYKLEVNVTKKDETTASVLMKVDYVVPLNEGVGVLLRQEDMLRPLDYSESTIPRLYKAELKGRFVGDEFILDSKINRDKKSQWVAESIDNHPDVLMIPPPMSEGDLLRLNKKVKQQILDSGVDQLELEAEVWMERVLRLIGN